MAHLDAQSKAWQSTCAFRNSYFFHTIRAFQLLVAAAAAAAAVVVGIVDG